MTLSEKISALRKQKGLSQDNLAAMMKITRQAVSRWEQGESVPDLDNIVRLSAIFDVSTDYLLKDGEPATYATTASSTASSATQGSMENEVLDMLRSKEKKPVPWIYEKLFANYFIYIVAIGAYVVLGYIFDWWRFGWPVLVILWIIQWAIEAWYEIDDDDE